MSVDFEGIGERYRRVLASVEAAAVAAGRDVGEVRLISVSKTRSVEEVRAAYAAGAREFGENYAQELRDKARESYGEPRPTWHYIGRLQKNKVKYVAAAADLFHAFDDLSLAPVFAKRRETPMGVLVAVNVGGELSKGGVPIDDALSFCEEVERADGVALRGLMTIPPPVASPEAAGPWFAQMAELAAGGRRRGLPLDELSMGMSGDYEVAIRHGATLVRVGTAIFGPRG